MRTKNSRESWASLKPGDTIYHWDGECYEGGTRPFITECEVIKVSDRGPRSLHIHYAFARDLNTSGEGRLRTAWLTSFDDAERIHEDVYLRKTDILRSFILVLDAKLHDLENKYHTKRKSNRSRREEVAREIRAMGVSAPSYRKWTPPEAKHKKFKNCDVDIWVE